MIFPCNGNSLARPESSAVYSSVMPCVWNILFHFGACFGGLGVFWGGLGGLEVFCFCVCVWFCLIFFFFKFSEVSTYTGILYVTCLGMEERATRCIHDSSHSVPKSQSVLIYCCLVCMCKIVCKRSLTCFIIVLSLWHHTCCNRKVAEQLGVSNSGFLLSLYPVYFPFTHSSDKWGISPSSSVHLFLK